MKKLAITAAAALATAALVLPACPAAALDDVDSSRLRTAVTTAAILGRTRAFQAIADSDEGTRATGTPGYDDSVAYVAKTLRKAGYKVSLQTFTFPYFTVRAPASVTETSPVRSVMATSTFTGSGSGDVTGPVVVAGGTTVPPVAGRLSASGCTAGTFGEAPSSKAVALVEDGTCSATVKAANARAAGYAAVVVFDAEGGTDVLTGRLDAATSIPVVGLSFINGSRLAVAAKAGPTTLHVTASTEADAHRRTSNVLADTPRGKTGQTVVVGGHLDSVPGSAGINDNASGNAATLEVAVQMARLGYLKKGRLQRQVRFAFWTGGEDDQLGSRHYVDGLSESQRAKTYAVLDYRALASKNYLELVYDGDGYETGVKGPPGSDAIEKLILAGPSLRGTDWEQFRDESDYFPFAAAGIPAGGANTDGFGQIRDPRQGDGEVGVAFDPCYHQACDDVSNLDPSILGVMGDLIAQTTLVLAVSKTGLFPDGS
jgi:Zn-dependent M28 family amino/carboxypeptidase